MNGVSRLDVVENVALISFKKIPHNLAFLADIFGRFSGQGVVIDMISQTSPLGGNVSISFSCLDKDMVKVFEISKELGAKYPQVRPMVSSGNCKLMLSGEEMRAAHGVFANVLACLAGADVDLLQVTTSETEISLLLPAANLEDAKTALEQEFWLV